MKKPRKKLPKPQHNRSGRAAGQAKRGRSTPARQRASLSPAAQAAKFQLLRDIDPFAEMRMHLKALGGIQQEWAGIPMPLEGQNLIIEPKYPQVDILRKLELAQTAEKEPVLDDPGVKFRNRFWVTRYHMYVNAVEIDGRSYRVWEPGQMRATMELQTMGASIAWGVEQEHAALQLLATLIPHHAFKKYLLTGMFLESSKRSGITYMFRKLRPTLALRASDIGMRVLCALCLHPIAYYAGSWAGAMCPTDDVIAHLALMRGDEPMFWRRANQHSPLRPEAGL